MMKSCMNVAVTFCFLVVITSAAFAVVAIVAANDTITVTNSLRDGETLVSSGGNFVLGFFNSGSTTRRYVGVWYKKVSPMTPVWIANRDSPLSDTSGAFQITNRSTLVIVNSTGQIIWATNSMKPILKNPIAQLLDNGNVVIRDDGHDDPKSFTWQSFDHPINVLLPGMKLGLDLATGLSWNLTSWRSSDDPASGSYTTRLDPRGYPELVVFRGSSELYRYGPWNGQRFSGIPVMNSYNNIYNYSFVIDEKEIYYTYRLLNTAVITHFTLSPFGSAQQIIWNEQSHGWFISVSVQSDTCDIYATCGAFGSCTTGKSPQCECVEGFVPKDSKAWDAGDWTGGCIRKTALACNQTGDGFLKYSNVKLPETKFSWYNTSMNLEECEQTCLKNCSCSAYANLDVRVGGSGCLLWFGDLKDIKQFSDDGQDLFIRLASSEIASLRSTNKNRKWIILGCTLSAVLVLLGIGLAIWVKKKKKKKKKQTINQGDDLKEPDLPLLDFNIIAQATDYFSLKNKIGEGGFGVVYKGRLEEGQDIAVKKLLKESSQGLDEFKNEVICIAKLQHRNLVNLIGCAVEADERLLVYEYVPNKGLDSFIFEQAQNTPLDWPKRFNIINGIARGLLYLHQDSRLRIVHRDLKASNVLLDHDLNPKIADFGTARCLYGDESLAKTRRVIGTYGYMSPEYAVDGIFSVKSDVFSFGVLVLEIISGVRNRGFTHEEHHLNLLGHAWMHFQEGEALKLFSTPVNNIENEVPKILRCIHVALLCVQQRPEDRPTMSSVVVMLSSDGQLPQPKHPGFFTERNLDDMNSKSSKDALGSVNEATVTMLTGR